MAKTYRELDIYRVSFDLFIETHRFTLKLPKYELYELGSQLRRSSDSVNTNIVEGYGRKRYKKDFVKFLTYSHASNDETVNHLRKLLILYPELNNEIRALCQKYDQLGGRIYAFTDYVEKNWRTK
ncbi:four helix bundle protein [Rhodohalobacter mucosus]|uniref:Four helix bundle protein n=1 Tax=Rhodohalobacter mucosus TaxID=2079485 RepID=A0A316TSN3_9BACT|nr:four helix bundle protein [Rhodohalobacter mucosus]PWN06878.1 four helix bundle protein [Rhodohalobacter mucosus]